MRRRTCCHTCLAFILKFLNLFQFFVGISIILYSAYMLNQWNRHLSIPLLPPSAPSPDSSTVSLSDQVIRLNFIPASIRDIYGGDDSHSPSPWFIYAFMGVGIMLCCVSCTGHIAAEAFNGCCLCSYTILKTLFILLEVAFILFIALDRHWEKDLPPDHTGEIDRLREFVEANIDFCEWVGIAVVVIQALCLLLAVVLRAMVTSARKDDENDVENGSDVRGKAWEPLLNPQTSVSATGDGKSFRSDIWSSRMREKYGLSSSNAK